MNKVLPRPLIAAVVLLLMSSAVFAIDSDGDGVDDGVDAFPNDGCASVDTDGDGAPNSIHGNCSILIDGFETGNFSANPWSGTSNFVVTSPGYTGLFRAASSQYYLGTSLRLTRTFPTNGRVMFYYRNKNPSAGAAPSKFEISGTTVTLDQANWTKVTVNVSTGSKAMAWTQGWFRNWIGTTYYADIDLDDIRFVTGTSLIEDEEDDNDSVPDTMDKFPLHIAASSDADNDSYADSWNTTCDATCQANSGLTLDNCPTTTNTSQSNFDGDSQGDACDSDGDNDGSITTADSFPYDPTRSAGNSNILFTLNGNRTFGSFGRSVSSAGDVNNDGYDDLIVGDEHDNNKGNARVFSGLNGSILYTFNGDNDSDRFGVSVSGVGDVNNDGYADVIIGAYQDDNNGTDSGSARVISGLNGSILYTFNGDSANDYFGGSVSGAGDINNDGYADMIVGASGNDNNGYDSGSARIFSGINGSILYTFNGDSANDGFSRVSGAGDVNNDGYADMIVGASGDDNNGSSSGSARVLSGANGAILYTFNGDSANDLFGNSVSGAGDVNNDGYADVIVGAFWDDNNGTDSGSARIFSGANGSILYTFNGDSANDLFGNSVSGAGDVNNDGYADVIVGAYYDDNNGDYSGSARVLSGANGAILYTFNGDSVQDYFSSSVSGAGDVNNDGYADVIVGAFGDDNNGTQTGSARLFSGKGLWLDTDGDGQNDAMDSDDDNDSVLDINDYAPLNPATAGDADSDGIDGLVDNCPSTSNPAQANFDGDTQGDACDTDDDNDGVLDSSDAFDFDPTESVDTDNDGIGNNADWDDDNDGVPDNIDAAPLNASNTSEITLPLNGVYKGGQLQRQGVSQ